MSIRLTGFAFGLMLSTGCASLLRPAAPASEPVVEAQNVEAPADTVEASVDAAGRIRQLLHHGFTLNEAGKAGEAADSLQVAAYLLHSHIVAPVDALDVDASSEEPAPPAIAPDELLRLTRAALGTAQNALHSATPLHNDTPLAELIDGLPAHFRRSLRNNPAYRELYLRRLAGRSDLPIDLNDRVREKIRYFQNDAPDVFRSWNHRSGIYAPLIRKTLREEGLPEDLLFLSMVESGFNTRAYSSAAAVGLWQFMRHTGRLYGLDQNTWIDERRDPEKATHAAARHLRHLYNLFGDWRLVMTAYNCGQGRLERAMRKDGSSDFWTIESLPRETLHHLPKIMAVLVMSKDPAFFGIHDTTIGEPFDFDVVKVAEAIDLRVAAECTGSNYQHLRDLNPELKLGYTPPLAPRKFYGLRVPVGTSERFITQYARIPESRKVRLADYQVRYGDTLSGIASRYGISSRALADANNIRNPRRLRAGQKLKIPVSLRNYGRVSMLAESTTSADESGEKVVYRVQGGDTLWDIARAYGVSTDNLTRWNAIKPGRHIQPGDRLTVYSRRGATPVASRSGSVAYRVKRGDTLWDIARAHGVRTSEIRRWNGLGPGRLIHPGDTLTLYTEGGVVSNVRDYYRVRPGDTLWDIARAFGTSVDKLRSLNAINDAGRIKAGDRLKIRDGAHVD